ncbi:hypothetical protein BD324DRAFT_361537 [Kockovaella imperatae]|uniref:Uncharacterized protein n=1 Tax=Kockovaella imperatae TaxID=4999 RepID=A0A1Y1UKH2_9TREE|nr:hypothetical protein BD324DRAFT_361537 [Kockovaella imperatae]ORX38499.1 hypothetical protein BD324DRAFT_361537 [Kockovaella imperatae]
MTKGLCFFFDSVWLIGLLDASHSKFLYKQSPSQLFIIFFPILRFNHLTHLIRTRHPRHILTIDESGSVIFTRNDIFASTYRILDRGRDLTDPHTLISSF